MHQPYQVKIRCYKFLAMKGSLIQAVNLKLFGYLNKLTVIPVSIVTDNMLLL